MRSPDDLLEGLTPAQVRAVTVESGPLCVLAGAGAGKTRVLTRRIAHRVATGSAEPSHVLVLTFTRKAAGELGGRLAAAGMGERVLAGTFHAVAAAQLRQWWRDRGTSPPVLLDRKARVLGPLAGRPGLAGVPLAALATEIEWAKARAVTPERYEEAVAGAGRDVPAPAAAVASLYRRYQDDMRSRGLVDFDDLLARCADALEGDSGFASAQRWRWRHLFVDEFQDVNPLQHRLLLAWLGNSTDLCVVGDPNQAIYAWNGADPGLLASFAERWPTATVVRLDDNHRCSPQVVGAAAAVIGDRAARSTRPDGPPVTVRAWPSDAAEADGTTSEVLAAHASGTGWSDMAVLVRTNAQVAVVADALRRAGVPHRTPGAAALADDPAVGAVLARWRASPRTLAQVGVADVAATLPGCTDEAAGAALSALVDLARSFERFEGPSTVGELVGWLEAAGGDRPGAPDAVTVSSFHRAKGLEWSAVWLCGLEAGLVPIGRAATPQALDEERRLLYVALTRASQLLVCSWARRRSFGAASVARQPSPWLHLVAPTGAPVDATPVIDADEWRARLEVQRERLASGAGRPTGRRRSPVALVAPDAELVDALRAWRAGVARASGVPAHVVLHDRTLDALASLRPGTTEELTAVPGLGPVKANRYGGPLLDIVARLRRPA